MQGFVNILAVAAGGAIGAVSRYGINRLFHQLNPISPTAFPWWTLTANLVGCFLAGVLYVGFDAKIASPTVKLAVMVGFLGALTTFSTYCLESLVLIEHKRYTAAGMNVVMSVVLGLIGVGIGLAVGKKLFVGG